MSREIAVSLVISLVLTVALEAGFFFAVGKRGKTDLGLLVMVNILTNPAVVLLHWLAVLYTDWSRVIIILPLEIFAVLTEGFYYEKYGREFKRPYLFSLAANAFSFGTGLILQLLQIL